jgi:hypothetical protein
MCPAAGGLAAQPLPGRPRRSRTRLPARPTARQHQRRRGRVGHHLAVTAQSLHPPRARHARPQPRGGPPARHRRRPPPQRPTSPAGHATDGLDVRDAQPRPAARPARPNPNKSCGSAGPRRSRPSATAPSSRSTRRAGSPPRWRIATIARRAERAQRLAGDRTGRADRRQAERAARTGHSSRAHHQPEERGMLIDAP